MILSALRASLADCAFRPSRRPVVGGSHVAAQTACCAWPRGHAPRAPDRDGDGTTQSGIMPALGTPRPLNTRRIGLALALHAKERRARALLGARACDGETARRHCAVARASPSRARENTSRVSPSPKASKSLARRQQPALRRVKVLRSPSLQEALMRSPCQPFGRAAWPGRPANTRPVQLQAATCPCRSARYRRACRIRSVAARPTSAPRFPVKESIFSRASSGCSRH